MSNVMSDEEKERLNNLWADYSTDVEFLSDADDRVMTEANFYHCVTEARKGMFTEKDVVQILLTVNTEMLDDESDAIKWLKQYLTERKTVANKRKCNDCGSVFGGDERCPECFPMG